MEINEKGCVGLYRYGFNGMENDNEVKGTGNHIDFGARGYDPRVGRWLSTDPQFKKQPGWSPYKYGLDNPIIFVDPDGETEFYYKGKWVGTDGVDNGIIGIVRSKKLSKEIKKNTKQGLNYSTEGVEHGLESGGVFGIHIDVLTKANDVLNDAMRDGQNKEFWAVMERTGSGFSTTHSGVGEEGTGQSDGFPSGIESDVSIHSHPTGSSVKKGPGGKNTVESYAADEASPGDERDVFPFFNMNIIVGKQGKPKIDRTPDGGVDVNDFRGSGINIFDREGNRQISISGGDAGRITNGDRGSLGKKFEKKQAD